MFSRDISPAWDLYSRLDSLDSSTSYCLALADKGCDDWLRTSVKIRSIKVCTRCRYCSASDTALGASVARRRSLR